jgi:hypothetical protein
MENVTPQYTAWKKHYTDALRAYTEAMPLSLKQPEKNEMNTLRSITKKEKHRRLRAQP